MEYINVENMQNTRGNKIPNQFVLRTIDGVYFQSYQTVIAFRPVDIALPILLDPKWNCSRTTSKYRTIFLDESTKETQAKIDNGEYKIAKLN